MFKMPLCLTPWLVTHVEKLLKYLKAPVSLYLGKSQTLSFFPHVSPLISPAFPHKYVELIYKPSQGEPRPLTCWFLAHRHGSSKSLAENSTSPQPGWEHGLKVHRDTNNPRKSGPIRFALVSIAISKVSSSQGIAPYQDKGKASYQWEFRPHV